MLKPWRHTRVRLWQSWSHEERQGAVVAGVVVVLALAIALLIHLDVGVVP